jgi:hypothetical protein
MPSIEIASPSALSSVSPDQLVDLSADPEMLEAVRAEVFRRLQDDPRKANFLTFRFLLPSSEEDRWDAFDGLIGTCWNAAEARHALKVHTWTMDFVEDARDAIKGELTNVLHDLRPVPPRDVIRIALNGGFKIDAEVANAMRRRIYAERRNASLREEDEFVPPRPDNFQPLIELITQEKSELVHVLGEAGWEVLWCFTQLVDADLLPAGQRDQERVLTEAIAAKRGVRSRQASSDKARFRLAFSQALQTGNPILGRIAGLLGLRTPRGSALNCPESDCRETGSDRNGL